MKNNEMWTTIGISVLTSVIVFLVLAQLFGEPLFGPPTTGDPGSIKVIDATSCRADGVCEANSIQVGAITLAGKKIQVQNETSDLTLSAGSDVVIDDSLKVVNQICFGENDCRTSWPSGGNGSNSQWQNGANGAIYYNNGNVGIGISNPTQKLTIYGPNSTGIRMTTTTNGYDVGLTTRHVSNVGQALDFVSYSPGYSSADMTMLGGKVGIGTTSPTQKLDVVGYVKGTGLCMGSDCRTSWPSGGSNGTIFTKQDCTFPANNQSGWDTCDCPSGYSATGWYGYNCENNGGEWECASTGSHGTMGVNFFHDGQATAWVGVFCARAS